MNLYYHNLYTYGIHKESTFPRERYVLIHNELKSFITTELKNREKYYLKAKYIIDADNYSINELSDKIHTFISST